METKRGVVGEARREGEGKRLDELSRLKGGTPASTKELLPIRRGESLIGKNL
jgi:hypothetical protein